MFLAAGCGGYTAAIFHLVTHAFFKALLFLGAGAVILAMHHEQDIAQDGRAAPAHPAHAPRVLCRRARDRRLPAVLGLLLEGRDPAGGVRLARARATCRSTAIGAAHRGLTSFYMFRLYFLVFHGESRAPRRRARAHPRVAGPWITIPLIVLAVLSVVGGLLGLPQLYGELFGVERLAQPRELPGADLAGAPSRTTSRTRPSALLTLRGGRRSRRSAVLIACRSTSRGPSCPRASRRASRACTRCSRTSTASTSSTTR